MLAAGYEDQAALHPTRAPSATCSRDLYPAFPCEQTEPFCGEGERGRASLHRRPSQPWIRFPRLRGLDFLPPHVKWGFGGSFPRSPDLHLLGNKQGHCIGGVGCGDHHRFRISVHRLRLHAVLPVLCWKEGRGGSGGGGRGKSIPNLGLWGIFFSVLFLCLFPYSVPPPERFSVRFLFLSV